jgi:hypothetical protein
VKHSADRIILSYVQKILCITPWTVFFKVSSFEQQVLAAGIISCGRLYEFNGAERKGLQVPRTAEEMPPPFRCIVCSKDSVLYSPAFVISYNIPASHML